MSQEALTPRVPDMPQSMRRLRIVPQPVADSPTIHAVGGAHVDDMWRWDRLEAHKAVLETYAATLGLMRRLPDFTLAASSTSFLTAIKEADPQMHEEIKERVTQGRIVPVGGELVEPDCNIPSGESRVRLFLYGQQDFYEEFGFITTAGHEPDAFGLSATTPKIAAHSGITTMEFMRPERNEMGLPHLFWHKSDDGSRVLTYRLPDYNTNEHELGENLERVLLHHSGDTTDALFFYGVGNHGGGPTENLIKELFRIKQRKRKIKFSSPQKFFETVDEQEGTAIPTVSTELNPHATGCYSAGAETKQVNRKAENQLLAAEKIRVVADALTDLPYPSDALTHQGRVIAVNQFHDTLGATLPKHLQDRAVREVQGATSESYQIAERGMLALVQRIHVPHQEGMTSLTALNTNVWESKVPLEFEVGGLTDASVIIDHENNQVPFQEIQSTSLGGPQRIRFMGDLPSMGWKTYRLLRQYEGEQETFESMEASPTYMDNGQYALSIDETTGYINGLFDKSKNINLFRGFAGVPVVIDEFMQTQMEDGSYLNVPADAWGHNRYKYDNIVGLFSAMEPPKLVGEPGSVSSTIRVKSGYYGDPDAEHPTSTMTQDYTMYKDTNVIRVDVKVDWQEKHKMLKLRNTVQVEKRANTAEIPYGTIERPENGNEYPQQSWFDMSGTHVAGSEHHHVGVSFINDGKYSYDVYKRDYNMTVLRSPIYSHHTPALPQPGVDYDYMDLGMHQFTYWIVPHDETWREANIPKVAAECSQPPMTLVGAGNERGTLPQEFSYAEIGADNVQMTVIKKPEDTTQEGTIIRLWETTNKTTTTPVRVGERTETVTIGHAGLKTLFIPDDPGQAWIETNGIELEHVLNQSI